MRFKWLMSGARRRCSVVPKPCKPPCPPAAAHERPDQHFLLTKSRDRAPKLAVLAALDQIGLMPPSAQWPTGCLKLRLAKVRVPALAQRDCQTGDGAEEEEEEETETETLSLFTTQELAAQLCPGHHQWSVRCCKPGPETKVKCAQ